MLNYMLLTEYGEALNRGNVLPEYPRPQLRRESYINLNGNWEYTIEAKKQALRDTRHGTICVPFPLESCLSGVRCALEKNEFLCYSREFDVPEDFIKDITLLHIGAADQQCEVMINGKPVGSHDGGYLPASFDVSGAIQSGKNKIFIRVRDEGGWQYPSGKQRKKRGGIWYTPISGIWQTVWLESVGRDYIRSVKFTPDLAHECVSVVLDSDASFFTLELCASGRCIQRAETGERCVSLRIPEEELHLWSPENPFLYDITITTQKDSVASYFAMRTFSTDGKSFLLNGKPYFINGVLDQGYFSDGIYTPASYKAYRDDILAMKRLGFNTLRKHIKIEPMLFYYYCDTLGMLVLQDMVNVGRYSFFKDSLLPFAGFRKRLPYENVSRMQRKRFLTHALSTLAYLYNCPSVVYYTIFNEGWGQFHGNDAYNALRQADPSRIYDTNSGWFHEGSTDVTSEHIYFKPIQINSGERPVIVSEFGGYSCRCAAHSFNSAKNFGYRNYETLEELEDNFVALYEREVLPNLKNGLAGAIYTQLSDVEDETNGILTYDRRMCKLNTDRIFPLMKRVTAEGSFYRAK